MPLRLTTPRLSVVPAATTPVAKSNAVTPVAPPATVVPLRTPARDASPAEVVFSRSGKTATGSLGQTVLEMAERAGLQISSACRAGACGTCRVVKLSGRVEMPNQHILSADQIEAGEILACVAAVQGRVVVDA